MGISLKDRCYIFDQWRFFVAIAIPIILCPLLIIEDTMEINGDIVETTVSFSVNVLSAAGHHTFPNSLDNLFRNFDVRMFYS